MKDMSINQKRWAEAISKRNFGQALFFVSPTPHYVARETKIEPDRRLALEDEIRRIMKNAVIHSCAES